MKTQENVLITTKINSSSYLHSIALSLIEYSLKDNEFKEIMRNALEQFSLDISTDNNFIHKNIISTASKNPLKPADTFSATNKLTWLINAITNENDINAAYALHRWKTENPVLYDTDPKQIVVGVVQVAIPGVTLGRIKRKKRKVSLLLEKDILEKNALSLHKNTNKAVLRMLESSITTAENKIHNLEPEMLEWFFGEKIVSLYSADPEILNKIKKVLINLHVPIVEEITEDNQSIIALSPAINEEWVNQFNINKII